MDYNITDMIVNLSKKYYNQNGQVLYFHWRPERYLK